MDARTFIAKAESPEGLLTWDQEVLLSFSRLHEICEDQVALIVRQAALITRLNNEIARLKAG